MPNPLNYEPRNQRESESQGQSDLAGWIIAAFVLFFILAFLGMAIT